MNKTLMFPPIKWVFVHGALLATLWFGLIEGVSGAWNLAVFSIWLSLFGCVYVASPRGIEAVRKRGRTVPAWATWLICWVVVPWLIWSSHWVLAVCFLMRSILIEYAMALAVKPETVAQ